MDAVPCVSQGKHATDGFWFFMYSPITHHCYVIKRGVFQPTLFTPQTRTHLTALLLGLPG